MSERVSDEVLRQCAAGCECPIHRPRTAMARELLAARERIAELTRMHLERTKDRHAELVELERARARLALAQRVIDLTDAYWARAETGSGAALRAARAEWDRGEK